jgi:transcriptional regulator with XRE-family HTH domain
LSTKFKQYLRENRLSQLQLSKMSGVAQSNLSIYCNHDGTLESSTMITRLRLAKAFGMNQNEFDVYFELPPAKIIASNKQIGNYEVTEVE